MRHDHHLSFRPNPTSSFLVFPYVSHIAIARLRISLSPSSFNLPTASSNPNCQRTSKQLFSEKHTLWPCWLSR